MMGRAWVGATAVRELGMAACCWADLEGRPPSHPLAVYTVTCELPLL